jgi:hypothetical protein
MYYMGTFIWHVIAPKMRLASPIDLAARSEPGNPRHRWRCRSTSAAMTKPTILQTLLGRPSQKYSFPREKEYHSAKRDLLRYVAEQPIDNDDNAGHREEPVESNREVPFVGKAVSLERDFQVRHSVIRID